MRWTAALAGLAVCAGVAFADPIRAQAMLAGTRERDAKTRSDAATRLAEAIQRGNARAVELGRFAVITNDPDVRAPIVDAMIAAKLVDRPTAALIPTAAVLDKRIHQLLRNEKPDALPTTDECKVTGGTARGAALECAVSRCPGGCIHVVRTFAVTTGVRWTIDQTERRESDDGSCGDCMLVE